MFPRQVFLLAAWVLLPALAAFPAWAAPLKIDPRLAERGKAVYARECSVCHGPAGKGDGEAAYLLFPAPREGARASHTRFTRLAGDAERALLLAEPSTGRTHQIRVHAASVGSPVVGDDLYGPPFAEGAPGSASRALLHAAALRLRLPDRRELELSAPLPAELLCAASRLG